MFVFWTAIVLKDIYSLYIEEMPSQIHKIIEIVFSWQVFAQRGFF